MAVHRYLFFAENDNLKVYLYHQEDKFFEPLKKLGEEVISIINSNEIFTWWKEEASFNSERDTTDFCLIYDKDYDFIEEFNFNQPNKTVWSKGVLNYFLDNYTDYSNVELIHNDNTYKFSRANKNFTDYAVKKLHTNVRLKNNDISFKDNKTNIKQDINAKNNVDIKAKADTKTNNNYSALAEFFIDKMASEK